MSLSELSPIFIISELRRNTLLQADYDTILNSCRTSKEFQSICNDKSFWEEKALKDFGTSLEEFNNTNLTPAQRYLQLLTEEGGVALGSEQFLSFTFSLNKIYKEMAKRAVMDHKDYIVQDLINRGYKDWDWLLYNYAIRNDTAAVGQFSKLADPNKIYQLIARGALEGEHIDLF